MAGPKATRLIELDALRGVAAVLVVLYHLTFFDDHAGLSPIQVPWGHFGVELFFIISGFVILMTLSRVRDLRDFVASRVARLYPAYWCAVLLTSLVAWGLETTAPSAGEVAANLTMLQGYALQPDIDGAYWTLTLELDFYLVMGGLLYFQQLGRIAVLAVVLMLALHGLHLAAALGLPTPALEFRAAQYAGWFVIGVCLFRLTISPDPWTVVALVLALCYAAWGGPPRSGAPGGAEYFPLALGLTALVWFAVRGRLQLLRLAPLVWLGDISYPLYLLHQRIGADVLGQLHFLGVPGPATTALAILLVVVLAAVVHILVEVPGRNWVRSIRATSIR